MANLCHSGVIYSVGDLVWLYTPAVPRGRAAKFHRPWGGPYRVVTVVSDVTYRIQLVTSPTRQDRRRRHRVVVHFNRLKPCHQSEQPQQVSSPIPQEGSPQTESPAAADEEAVDWEEWTVPLPIAPTSVSVGSDGTSGHSSSGEDSDVEETSQEPARGGQVWGTRLRRHIQRPDYYRPGTGNALQRRE